MAERIGDSGKLRESMREMIEERAREEVRDGARSRRPGGAWRLPPWAQRWREHEAAGPAFKERMREVHERMREVREEAMERGDVRRTSDGGGSGSASARCGRRPIA